MYSYYLVLGLLLIIFLYKLLLLILELNSSKRGIPENLSDIYSESEFNKWNVYHNKKIRLRIIELVTKYLILLLLLGLKVYSFVSKLFGSDLFSQTIGVILLSIVVDEVVGAIFKYINTMKIDKEYGISVMTNKLFIIDEIKGLIIGFILSFGIVMAYAGLHYYLGDWIILVFSILLIIIVLVVSLFLPTLMKVYYRCDDLEEGELRTKLENLLNKHGYQVRKIGVMNQSKRSTTGNALFTGMGKFKTIILFDTIMKQLTPDEIVAVFSHELGHGKHKDTLKNYLSSIIGIVIFVLISWLITHYNNLFTSFGFDGINYGFIFIILSEVVLELGSPLIGLITNGISRKAEYEADNFACSEGYGLELVSALKKLSNSNMANLNPHPLLVKLNYSHPPMSERIDNILSHTDVKEES